MSLSGTLIHFGLKQLFDISTKELFDWIDERFADSSQRMPRAIFQANQRAWQVVGLALAEDTFFARIKNVRLDGDLKAANTRFRKLLEEHFSSPTISAQEIRARASQELLRLQQSRSRPDSLVLARGAESLQRFADPSAIANEAIQSLATIPELLDADAPHLALVLRVAAVGSPPLLESLYLFFFRRLVERNTELCNGLTQDQLRAILRTQDHAFALLDARTSGILDQIDILFDQLSNLEVKLDAGFAQQEAEFSGVNEKLTEIKAQLHEMEQRQRQEIERKKRELEEAERKKRELEEAERKKRELEEAEKKQRLAAEAKKKAEDEERAKDPFHPGRVRSPGETLELNLPGNVPMKFAWCPPGSFQMGSNHPEGRSDEKPVHKVTLSKGFFMGIHPVTQAQWKAVMGSDPSHFKGDARPVEQVSWNHAQEFCRKLTGNLNNRVTVRLPTEAEWEYACRAGTATEYHFGDVINTDLVNYDGNHSWNGSPKGKYVQQTTPVGSYPGNPWGLFDVHGNVWEWCEDWYGPYTAETQTDPCRKKKHSDEYRVLRGGSWNLNPQICRSAYRNRNTPTYRYCNYCGFRACFRLD